MTKQELLKTHSAEQLAEMVEKLQEQTEVLQDIATEKERKMEDNIITVVVEGIAKEYQIEEIGDIVRAYEEIKLCKEMNKECKTILPAEYLKVLMLNQAVSELQSEVQKYRKAFEDAKKERDCQICEYQKKIDELKQKLERQETATKYAEEYVDSLKKDFDRSKNTINQIDDILEKLFGVRHDTVDKPDEFEKILTNKVKGNATDFLPIEPIKVTDMLINASKKRTNCMTGKEYDKYIFEKWQLRQIAEHLLVYCNHNGEVEE